jgi:hypothetical protein
MPAVAQTHIVIPDGVTSIGFGAYSGHYDLTDITIPKSVISIGEVPFSSCGRLNAITVDPLNPVYSSVDGVLFNKDKTKIICYPGGKTGSFTIPDSVTSVDDYAFQNAAHITSVIIPDSVTTIEWHSFYCCAALTNVTIGKNVHKIADGEDEWIPFSECPSLASIAVDALNPVYSSADGVLLKNNKAILIKYPEGKAGSYIVPNSVTKIETHSFSRSVHLTSVTIADSVNTIEDNAFENCFGLTNVIYGKKLKVVGDSAFTYCTNLTSIEIPDGVTKIGDGSFAECANLTNVIIGKGITSIGNGCFSDCRNLKSISVGAKNPTYTSADGVLINMREATLVKCPEGKTGSYTIPNGISIITGFALSSLTNVVVPKSVKRIEGQAFLHSKVTAIYFEGNAPQIIGLPRGAELLAFADCDNLTFYYRQGTRGWQSEFAGRPAVLWK